MKRLRPPTRYALAFVAGLTCQGSAAVRGDEPPPSLAEISAGIKRQWDKVQSLYVHHDVTHQALTDHGAIVRYSYLGTLDGQEEFFAFNGVKRYYRFKGPRVVKNLAPDAQTEYDVIPGGKDLKKSLEAQRIEMKMSVKEYYHRDDTSLVSPGTEIGYDGTRIVQKQLQTNSFAILAPENMPDFANNFVQNYLNAISRPLRDPFNPRNDRTSWRLPDAFAMNKYEVKPAAEAVEGASCVVVTSPGRETFWLDPRVNFGVRRHDVFDADSKRLRERKTNRDFAEVAPGVWLPKTCWRDEYAPPLAPPPYRGEPLYRDVYTVKKIIVNDVEDELFEVKVEPGWRVSDATRLPRKDNRNQFVSYEMPADASLLDKVAAQALGDQRQTSMFLDFVTTMAILGILVVVTLLVFRSARRKAH
jgi:hypothetical protein